MKMQDGNGTAAGFDGRIGLGSRVRVSDPDGSEDLSIVGPDEADARAGLISMQSPVGRALLGRSAGEEVKVRTPEGVRGLTVVSVE
jgi:transcription elongation GreA/GreB family factor